jgi:hypothetical protein
LLFVVDEVLPDELAVGIRGAVAAAQVLQGGVGSVCKSSSSLDWFIVRTRLYNVEG